MSSSDELDALGEHLLGAGRGEAAAWAFLRAAHAAFARGALDEARRLHARAVTAAGAAFIDAYAAAHR